jgi:glucose/arabinose dehydrogenase
MKWTTFIPCFFVVFLSLPWLAFNRVQAQRIPPPLAAPRLNLEVITSGLVQPLDIAHAGDDRLFIVEQVGRVRIVAPGGIVLSTPFLDITDRVNTAAWERGLLGIAFSPDYASDGAFYVNYTGSDGGTRISRFRVSADPNVANPASEEVLLSVAQPFNNHNGGCLRFGPDGYLYIGLGDGGSFGDPGNRSQNPANLLGKMLRLDVSGPGTYAIPPDNPFATDPDTLAEIWHLGLRNPWRFSFDRLNGNLWIGDVGQNAFEEVNLQPASSSGGENWGWRCYEADAPYNTSGCSASAAYDAPVFVYPHATGGRSVTGGVVYRGEDQHNLFGHYVLADYVSGRWWTLQEDPCSGEYAAHALGILRQDISSLAESQTGELFATNLATGQLIRITETCSALRYELAVDRSHPDFGEYWVIGQPDATVSWYVVDTAAGGLSGFCEPFEAEIVRDSVARIPYCGSCLVFARLETPDGCTVHSLPLPAQAELTSIADLPGQGPWRVYPQPAGSLLVLESPVLQHPGALRIADASGRVWWQGRTEAQPGTWQLDVSRWPSGMYFLQHAANPASPDAYRLIQRILVQH